MDIKVTSLLKSHSASTSITIKSFDTNFPLRELKKLIIQQFNIKLPYSRIGLSYLPVPGVKDKLSMSEDKRPVKSYDLFCESSEVFIKDIGPQISYRLTYVIEYLGPLIIPFLYYYRLTKIPNHEIATTQTICLIMSTFHYLKRILESLFLHIFSRDTMPLFNLFKNCLYYWGLYGVFCGYFLWNPNYHEKQFFKFGRYIFIPFFISAEVKNLKCHIIQMENKMKNGGNKNILTGEGFELVTCANYFWEILSWFCFSMFCFHWAFFLFTVAGFYQMRIWAIKKHKDMKKRFGDKYPPQRKILIPYIF